MQGLINSNKFIKFNLINRFMILTSKFASGNAAFIKKFRMFCFIETYIFDKIILTNSWIKYLSSLSESFK